MEIIIYAQKNHSKKDKLLNQISPVPNLIPVIVFDFEALFNTVKSKLSGQYVIVFLISDSEELEFLIANISDLFNSRIILILPTREESMVSKGLLLYPRYLAHENHEFKDVSAVLNKMIQNHILKKKNINNKGENNNV